MTGSVIAFDLGIPICAIPECDMYNGYNLYTVSIYYNNGYKIAMFHTSLVLGIFSTSADSTTFRIWYI